MGRFSLFHKPSHVRRRPHVLKLIVAATAVLIGAVVTAAALPSFGLSSAASAETIWGNSTPANVQTFAEHKPLELGTSFTAQVDGEVTAIRFFKSDSTVSATTGSLWSSSGSLLATASFPTQTGRGWQVAELTTPVTVTAGSHYVTSYLSPDGSYAATTNYQGHSVAPNALSTTSRSPGVYRYGRSAKLPTSVWYSTNYWVDVAFVPEGASPSPTPSGTPSGTNSSTPGSTPSSGPSSSPSATPTPVSTPKPSHTARPTGSGASTPSPTPSGTPSPSGSSGPQSGGSAAFAGPSNTGPAVDGALPTAAYTGPMDIKTNGTVISHVVITGQLAIEADNVTVQDSIFTGANEGTSLSVWGTGDIIKNNLITGASATDSTQDPWVGIEASGTNLVFEGNELRYIAGDGVNLWESPNLRFVGNWIHDFVGRNSVHYDGLNWPDPTNSQNSAALIQNNRIEVFPSGKTSGGVSDAIGLWKSAPKTVVDHNLLAGATYYVIAEGGGGTVVTNNWIWYENGSTPWVWFPNPGVTFTGNVITKDGATVSETIDDIIQ